MMDRIPLLFHFRQRSFNLKLNDSTEMRKILLRIKTIRKGAIVVIYHLVI